MALRFDEHAPVLEIKDLSVSYSTRAGEIPAVIDFSLTVQKGESVGLVGESGCGKSTVAMAIMQYMGRNGAIKRGSIRFKGVELTTLRQEELRQLRGSKISMIYQEPFAALNPSLTLGRQLMEVPIVHEGMGEPEARARAIRVLGDVRIPDPERVMTAYPHQISGGQQQRVVIAMALLSNPALLLLDEPTTALDVTVEAGITKLIGDISQKYGTSQIYISHNLGLIREVCDRVSVMYSGEVVEEGTIQSLFTRPKHPYTHGLFGCIPLPSADKNAAPLKPIRGQLPCRTSVRRVATSVRGVTSSRRGGATRRTSRCWRSPGMAQPRSIARAASVGARSTSAPRSPAARRRTRWRSVTRCSRSSGCGSTTR